MIMTMISITIMYGCEILNYTMSYMSNVYDSWRKIIPHIFRLPQRTQR